MSADNAAHFSATFDGGLGAALGVVCLFLQQRQLGRVLEGLGIAGSVMLEKLSVCIPAWQRRGGTAHFAWDCLTSWAVCNSVRLVPPATTLCACGAAALLVVWGHFIRVHRPSPCVGPATELHCCHCEVFREFESVIRAGLQVSCRLLLFLPRARH